MSSCSIHKVICPDCHTVHNRDVNASVKILNKGLQMLSA